MKTPLFTTALLASTVLAAPVFAQECAALADIDLRNVDITNAAPQDAGTLPPDPMSAMTGGSPRPVEAGAHCLVEGKIEDRTGADGKQYGIRFQLRMPDDWNGKFLFQGGGGTDGFIAPAIGAIPSTGSTATPALQRGYAVVSMDGGHAEMNLDFAADQQARLDLAYAAIGKVAGTAKALIRSYYEGAPEQSYFMGCSNGGREAMMAAERFPLEFDGVVVGNPGFHLSRAALGGVWDVTQWAKVSSEGAMHEALTQAELATVSAEILKQCDALDGLEDGTVAYGQCDFDPEALRGQLPEDKLGALLAVMGGARDADGNQVYSGWPWDPGISSAGWRAWKLGTAEQPAMHETLTVPSTGAVFMTPPQPVPENPDFAELADAVADVGGYFDSDETFLTSFAARGGKMVIFQGAADPIFSAKDITRWYGEATEDTGADFARLFVVPGMTHCGGGDMAFEDFDPLTLLEEWQDSGEAPEVMPASAPAMPDREMPVCAYPAYAEYTGGDEASLESFSCRQP